MPAFLIPTVTTICSVIAVLVLVTILIKSCWKIAGTNEVMIITGLGKTKYITGSGKFVIPLLQKTAKMTLENIQVDFMSRNEIPTKDAIHLQVDAVANMSISKDPARMAIAASRFAGYSIRQIQDTVIRVLEGNIREIISQTNFEDLIRGDKKAFSELVMENVTPNLADLGIDLTTFNIQNFSDRNGVIQDLGIENIQKIKKEAQIAAANAQAEVKIAQARADQDSNAARVAADIEIARKQNEAAIEKARLKREADTEQAAADAAKDIEAENQRRTIEIATAEANLARQEKQIELEARAVEITKRKLEAEIKEKAEAEKYAEKQRADARLYATQKAAEADLFERERKAEALKVEAEKKAAADLALATAEAEAQKKLAEAIEAEGKARAAAKQAEGLAEADAIRAKAEAEAKGMFEKAEALKQYGDAARQQMELEATKVLYEQLPKIAEAIGKGYNGANIHLIGNDSGQLAGNMMSNITQIIEGFKGSTGIDPVSVISGMLGSKIATNTEGN